ncbi:MAG: translocation/assembly module TamB domain-containing protein [Bacteroidia bacterium]|nr:translocation/assembly module TamB domain-containing protein [Bacteroidia bacterium]MDW8235372.1 translocation/assembly module TamB domain-containing protein [Bacteroidia bacterium]
MPVRVRLRALLIRLVWGLFFTLAGVAFLIEISALTLNFFLRSETGRSYIVHHLLQAIIVALHTDAEVEDVWVSPSGKILLKRLTIYDKACVPFIRVKEAKIHWIPLFFWRGIWKGKLYIPLSSIELYEPQVLIYQEKNTGLTNIDRLFPADTSTSESAPLRINLSHLLLQDGTLIWRDSTASSDELRAEPGFLHYAHLWIDSLSFSGSLSWNQKHLFARIARLSLRERNSGQHIQQLSLVLEVSPQRTLISDLSIVLPKSHIRGRGIFPKEGLDKLFLNTETKFFRAYLEGTITWEEIAAFAGTSLPLQGSWYVQLPIEGDLYYFHTPNAHIRFSEEEYLKLEGSIFRYARPSYMHWQAHILESSLSLGKLKETLPLLDFPSWMNQRVRLNLRGKHTGRLHTYAWEIESDSLKVIGNISLEAVWRYAMELSCEGWPVYYLIPDSPVRQVRGKVSVKGHGFALDSLESSLQVFLTGMDSLGHSYALTSVGEVLRGSWRGSLSFALPQGQISFTGILGLGGRGTSKGYGYVKDLQAALWGGEGRVNADFGLQAPAPLWQLRDLTLTLSNASWRRGDIVQNLPAATIKLYSTDHLVVEGERVQLAFEGIGPWQKSLRQEWAVWQKWIETGIWQRDSALEKFALRIEGRGRGSEWLELAGFPDLHVGQWWIRLLADADSHATHLSLEAHWDTLDLQNIHLYQAAIQAHTQDELLGFVFSSSAGKAGIQYDSLFLSLDGIPASGHITGYYKLPYKEGELFLPMRWTRSAGSPWIWLSLEEVSHAFRLVLHGRQWRLYEASDVGINLPTREWELRELRLQSENSLFHLSHRLDTTLVELENLPMEAMLAATGIELPVVGLISGRWSSTQDTSDFFIQIDSLHYYEQPYPTLRLLGTVFRDRVNIHGEAKDKSHAYFVGLGNYELKDTIAPLSLDLYSLRVPVEWLKPFTEEYLQSLKGSFFSQHVAIRGSLTNPQILGKVTLQDVSFYVPFLRGVYNLSGNLLIKGDSLYLQRDTLWLRYTESEQVGNKRALLSGVIHLKEWQDILLNLRLNLLDHPFPVGDIPASAETYVYGKAELDEADIVIQGDWRNLSVEGDARFAERTYLTLPLQLYERQQSTSHIRFVGNRETQAATITPAGSPRGMSLRIALSSVPQARFRILFDERTGDEIIASGEARLLLTLSPTGELGLSGSYEVQNGEYDINLQSVISKKLILEPGGQIRWQGDIYGGQLDLTAVYKTRTSLRAIDTSFSYTLPVEVKVRIQGSLLAPTMRFQIEIPSLTGTPTPAISLFLRRIASDEQERNRQAFALMVLGSFVPLERGFGGRQVGGGVSSTLAEFLSAQLSSWVGQTLGSNMGVSFSLGQWNQLSAQVNLSLGQRLTIEREGVLIGSGQRSANLGNLSAQYRILPARIISPTQWRLEVEGFSRQTFLWGTATSSSQGIGLRLEKSFYPPPRRRRIMR